MCRIEVGSEALEGKERKEREEESRDGTLRLQQLPDLLAMLAMVAVDSRREELRESLEERRARAAEMNIRVSCSVIGEGPGRGGKGEEGGNDGGGLICCGRVVRRGLGGICVGGAGKEESRRGTALRLSSRWEFVENVVVMA